MEAIPWYAWIVIVAMLVTGIVQIARIMGERRAVGGDPDLRARVISLEQRVDRLDRP